MRGGESEKAEGLCGRAYQARLHFSCIYQRVLHQDEQSMVARRKHGDGFRGEVESADDTNSPRSFVVKQGHVGASLSQLVHDMRKVMEPNTATRLKVSPADWTVTASV